MHESSDAMRQILAQAIRLCNILAKAIENHVATAALPIMEAFIFHRPRTRANHNVAGRSSTRDPQKLGYGRNALPVRFPHRGLARAHESSPLYSPRSACCHLGAMIPATDCLA